MSKDETNTSEERNLSLEEAAKLTSVLTGLNAAKLMKAAAETVRPSLDTVSWIPPEPNDLAELLPDFGMLDMVGRGGMGAVYRAYQDFLDREVAIKVLPTEMARDAEFQVRFQEEARTLGKLDHSGIVRVFEFGETEKNHLFFVMEFVDGQTLHELIHGSGLGVRRTLDLMIQICEALDFAHEQGVIHRDLKPANIMVSREGKAKLTDFGLARPVNAAQSFITQTHMQMGTPDYMSPEQLKGESDRRSDLYALGVLFYEMLCQQTPRGAWKKASVLCGVDVRYDRIIDRALQTDPDARFQTASEMQKELEALRMEPSRSIVTDSQPAAISRNEKLWRSLAVISIMVLLFTAGWLVHRQVTLDRKRNLAMKKTDELMNVIFPDIVLPLPPVTAPYARPADETTTVLEEANQGRLYENSIGMRFLRLDVSVIEAWVAIWETRRGDFDIYRSEANLPPLAENWPSINTLDNYPFTKDHPVVMVNWFAALDFCRWLTESEHRKQRLPPDYEYRLPNSAEWAHAAGLRGSAEYQSTVFAWGSPDPLKEGWENFYGQENDFFRVVGDKPVGMLPHYSDGFPRTSPVGFYRANAHGYFDMGGNVREWTKSEATYKGKKGVIRRGFDWKSGAGEGFRLQSSFLTGPNHFGNETGFRVVLARKGVELEPGK